MRFFKVDMEKFEPQKHYGKLFLFVKGSDVFVSRLTWSPLCQKAYFSAPQGYKTYFLSEVDELYLLVRNVPDHNSKSSNS